MYLQFRHKYQKMQPMSRVYLLEKFCCSFKSNLESFCIITVCVPVIRNTIVIACESKHPSVGSEGQETKRTVVPVSLKPVRLSSLKLERKQPFVLLGPSADWLRPPHVREGCRVYTVYQFKW